MLQGFARGILASRNLDVSAELFAIESQSPVFSSPISSYQSSSIIVKIMKRGMRLGNWLGDTIIISPGQLLSLVPLFIIFTIISPGFLVLLPQLLAFFMKVAKISPAFPHSVGKKFKSLRTNHIYHLVPSRLPSQRILFRSLITLVFLLVLWIGLVRTHMSSYVTHVDHICSPTLHLWSFSPGSDLILVFRGQASNTVRPFLQYPKGSNI